MAHVFVYGTLLRGAANHDVLARLGARFVARARTAEPRTLLDLGPYPALLPRDAERDRDASPVFGEVYAVPDGALDDLDVFEGCPDLYRREPIALEPDGAHGGEPTPSKAFTYVLARRPPARARPVPGGRYAVRGAALPAGASPSQLGEDPLDK